MKFEDLEKELRKTDLTPLLQFCMEDMLTKYNWQQENFDFEVKIRVSWTCTTACIKIILNHFAQVLIDHQVNCTALDLISELLYTNDLMFDYKISNDDNLTFINPNNYLNDQLKVPMHVYYKYQLLDLSLIVRDDNKIHIIPQQLIFLWPRDEKEVKSITSDIVLGLKFYHDNFDKISGLYNELYQQYSTALYKQYKLTKLNQLSETQPCI